MMANLKKTITKLGAKGTITRKGKILDNQGGGIPNKIETNNSSLPPKNKRPRSSMINYSTPMWELLQNAMIRKQSVQNPTKPFPYVKL